MLDKIKNILKKLGVDWSIAYSSGARVVQGFTGAVSIIFISTFLTGVEQGFYFTFGSITAIQVFFELGLTGIITQYVAHEDSHLSVENNRIVGDERYRSRLASLLHFCVKWYAVISVLLFFTLLIVGFVFFNRYGKEHQDVSWQIPWILICIGTVIKLFQSPLSSFIQGLGYVKEMSKVGFWQQIILPLSSWIGLACNFKLYVVGISSILAALIWNVYVQRTFLWGLLKDIWITPIHERVSYMKEIFPYQWRIALSWISGYFIFQLFNPVLFATDGPKVAGQMGMTLNVLNAIQAFAFSWMSTKVPLMSKLIALKDYVQLDAIFNKTLKQMVRVCVAMLCVLFVGIWFLQITNLTIGSKGPLYQRFLGYLPTLLMAIPLVLNMYVFSWATYLRCHKKEPWLLNSVICGTASLISTLTLGKLFGLYGVVGGYFAIQLLAFPWGIWIFKTKKREWHGNK